MSDFDELFPGLAEQYAVSPDPDEYRIKIYRSDIAKHCIDKQRIKKIFENEIKYYVTKGTQADRAVASILQCLQVRLLK